MIFVDTNYFLRLLVGDVPAQQSESKDLFLKAAGGEIELFTSTIVFFEIYWTLRSFYHKDKQKLINVLSQLLEMTFVNFEHHLLLKSALDTFTTSSLEYVDCFNLVYAKKHKATDFKTFDTKLSKAFKPE